MNNLIATHKDRQLQLALSNLFGKVNHELYDFIYPLLEWKEILGKDYLFHQGDEGDHLYILVSGRMQAITYNADQSEKILGEIVKGESIGEMALFTNTPRSASVKAIRDSQVVIISRASFEQIVSRYPSVNIELTKQIVDRLKKHNLEEKITKKVTNIALVPLSRSIRLDHFANQLEHQIATHGKVLNLTSGIVNRVLSNDKVSSASTSSYLYDHFSNWLEEKEYENDYLLFQADTTPSEWTKRCLRQADEIILIADANQMPSLTELEARLLRGENKLTNATQKLVLINEDQEVLHTAKWLQHREAKTCYHINKSSEKDMQKLARFLTGNAVGLVLSGGGAKGLAHIGVYRALKEYDIPVDFVGGTSIGSIIASMIAMGKSPTEVFEIAQEIFMANPTSWRDYNLFPTISLLKGKQMNKAIEEQLSNKMIEDMPINFFCVSANLSQPKMVVHESGLMGSAVRASISLPGVFPPAIIDNDLHIDGGMVNNLPVDIMEQKDVGYTIAVDLDSSKTKKVELEKMPTGWQYLSSKIFKRKRYRIPNIMSTMMQSSMITSLENTRVTRERADIYINPNVSKFGLMAWKKFHQIEEIGYLDTIQKLENWKGFKK